MKRSFGQVKRLASPLVHELAPVNRDLVAKRDVIQAKIDGYHKARRGQPHDPVDYKAFLQDIGYLLPEPRKRNRVDRLRRC